MNKNKNTIKFMIIFGAAAAGFIVTMSVIGAGIGLAVGLVVPSVLEKVKRDQYLQKFSRQLPDAASLLASCLKAGLSLPQAFEVLVAEVSGPIHDEFLSTVNNLRIGVSLEEAFYEMSQRVPLEELKLVFTAILVARETGGELPKVLSKLVDTLRDRRRLEENITTYTIQGKIQALVMGLIPVGFVAVVLQQDPHHFDIMLKTETGRILLIVAGVLQVLAVFFVIKISQIRI